MDRWHRRIMMLAVIAGTAAQALAQGPPALTQNCLVEAQNSYRNMRLLDTIEVLTVCRDKEWPDLNVSQKTAAFRLLTISYFAQGDSTRAQDAVMDLFGEDRRYRSNPNIDPVFFQTWIHELRPKVWYQQWWFRITAGAVVSGVAGCWLAGCFSSKPESLPGADQFSLPTPPSN